jgi:1-aminocyclopropane-1-carboxylate deaminase
MAKEQGLKSIGIIRGEKEYANNPTLKDATDTGMQLEFITRKDYKSRNDPIYLAKIQQQYPNAFIIPEGGSSQLAVGGCSQLAKDIDAIQKGDILAVPCGTGATLAGLICGNSHYKQIHGYAVLLDDSLEARVQRFIEKEKASTTDYKIYKADFGGYAKISKELLDFIFNWLEQTGILLDPIYTSKMCMYLVQQIKAGEFQAGSTITIIHTGGLQGWRGMEKRVTQLAGIDKWNLINNNL